MARTKHKPRIGYQYGGDVLDPGSDPGSDLGSVGPQPLPGVPKSFPPPPMPRSNLSSLINMGISNAKQECMNDAVRRGSKHASTECANAGMMAKGGPVGYASGGAVDYQEPIPRRKPRPEAPDDTIYPTTAPDWGDTSADPYQAAMAAGYARGGPVRRVGYADGGEVDDQDYDGAADPNDPSQQAQQPDATGYLDQLRRQIVPTVQDAVNYTRRKLGIDQSPDQQQEVPPTDTGADRTPLYQQFAQKHGPSAAATQPSSGDTFSPADQGAYPAAEPGAPVQLTSEQRPKVPDDTGFLGLATRAAGKALGIGQGETPKEELDRRQSGTGEGLASGFRNLLQEGPIKATSDRMREYLNLEGGADSALPHDLMVQKLDRTLKENPQLDLSDQIYHTVQRDLKNNDVDGASKFIQGLRPAAEQMRAFGLAALNHANLGPDEIAKGLKFIEMSHNYVPDGTKLNLTRYNDGTFGATVTPRTSNEEPKTYRLTPEQLYAFASGPASQFDHIIDNGTTKNLDILTGKGATVPGATTAADLARSGYRPTDPAFAAQLNAPPDALRDQIAAGRAGVSNAALPRQPQTGYANAPALAPVNAQRQALMAPVDPGQSRAFQDMMAPAGRQAAETAREASRQSDINQMEIDRRLHAGEPIGVPLGFTDTSKPLPERQAPTPASMYAAAQELSRRGEQLPTALQAYAPPSTARPSYPTSYPGRAPAQAAPAATAAALDAYNARTRETEFPGAGRTPAQQLKMQELQQKAQTAVMNAASKQEQQNFLNYREKIKQGQAPTPQEEETAVLLTHRINKQLSGAGGGQAVPPQQATPQQPVRVRSPDEARRLPSGTPIILPDGTLGRVP